MTERRPLNIYLDDGFADQHGGGIASYTRLLHQALVKEGAAVERARHPFLARIRPAGVRRLLYTLYLNFVLPVRLRRQGVAVAHFTNYQTPLLRNGVTRYVATIHDLSPILHPATNGPLYRRYFALMVRLALRRAHVIVSPSESVKHELQRHFAGAAKRVTACPIGLDGVFTAPTDSEGLLVRYAVKPNAYFLFVGRLEKRKNLLTLVRAFEKYKQVSQRENKLVLVGTDGIGAGEIRRAIRDSACREDIVATGYVSADALRSLYAHALAFVFPSHYEGFGIPLLEAMKHGLPLIVSRIPTTREIVGEGGHYFEADNADELRDVLHAFDRGRPRVPDYSEVLQRYSFERMAEAHVEAYKCLDET